MQSNQRHTFVVPLDPPIRKGQTMYPHIVMHVLYLPCFIDLFSHMLSLALKFYLVLNRFMLVQFETDYVVESTLVMNADLYATKYKDKIEPTYKVMILTCLIL